MAIESDLALLDAVQALAADLEVGGQKEWALLLRDALRASVVSTEGKAGVRSALRKLRAAEVAFGPGGEIRLRAALAYLDQDLGQEPQY